ncbi:MAG TPA: PA14 domain-containing protein, partial [Gemmataceae bacterium]|nr:PA14 domain-containing protein [Gemmataceae bacterium]
QDTFNLQVKKATDTTWTTIINQTAFNGTGSGSFALSAGVVYDVQVAFTHGAGASWAAQLHWSSPSTPDEAIEPLGVSGINAGTYNNETYADAMKMGRTTWEDGSAQDANGWPLADDTNVLWEGADPANVAGTYLLTFSGKAAVSAEVFGPATFQVGSTTYDGTLPLGVGYNAAANTTTATLTLTSDNAGILYLGFQNSQRTATSATNTGVTNVQLMRPTAPGASTSYSPGTVFASDIKDAYRRFTAERWLTANFDSTQTNWSDRTPPGYFKAALGDRGEVWEYEVMLANETGKDLYITIPINASADYVAKLANLLRYGSDGINPYTSPQAHPVYPGLNTNLKVYVEWSNEVWNWAFDQASAGAFAAEQAAHNNTPEGQIINFDGTAPDGDFRRWAALKTVETSNTLRSIWGDAAMGNQVRVLLEYQYDNFQDTAGEAFRFLDNYFNNGDGQQHIATPHPINYYIWGAGGAVYYSSPNPDGTQTATTVPDAGFETASVAAGTATVAPAGTPWTFTGNAGVYRSATHPTATTGQTLGTIITPSTSQAVGYRFTVGSSNLVVYALGRWVVAGNSGTHTLHLFSAADGSEIESADLDTSTATAGQYAYVNLPFPITLQAGRTYYVLSDEWAGEDRYADQNTTLSGASGITINGAARGVWNNGWTFTSGTSGNHAYGPLNFTFATAPVGALGYAPDPLQGRQAAFLGDTGRLSVTINFSTTGVFAFNVAAANKDGIENAIRLYLDGVEITPNGNDYRAQNAPWIPGQYLFGMDDRAYNTFGTAPFTITTPGNHTLLIVGTGDPGTYTYLDNLQITSLDAIFNAGIPGNGQANGQPQQALAAYQDQLNSQAKYAETFGLHVVAYEGGWSVGGDNGGTPLQNYGKFVDPRAAQANITSLDDFTRSGGALYTFGSYDQWPGIDSRNSGAYPLVQGVDARNQTPPVAATNGTPAPGPLPVANPTWDNLNSGGSLATGGWMSWNFIVSAAGSYTFTVGTDSGGNVRVVVDGSAVVAAGASGGQLTGTLFLTQGLHAVMVKAIAGGFAVNSVTVTAGSTGNPGPVLAPSGLGVMGQNDLTQATLNWTNNGSGATGLRLQRATDAAFTQNLTAFTLAASATTYTDTGLNSFATYYYRIQALSPTGDSAFSNTAVLPGALAASNVSGLTAGLDYSYYQGTWSSLPNFSTLTPVKTGTVTTFDLSISTTSTNWAVVYSGYLNVPASGTYTFSTTSDDGSALYLDGVQVVNNDGLHAAVTASGAVRLQAGTHALKVAFFQQGGDQTLTVSWAGPNLNTTAIPASALLHVGTITPPPPPPPPPPDTSTPVDRYTFDNTAADSAGSNNGTLVNSPVFVAGRVGSALSFNGVNQYVNVGANLAPLLGGTATLTVWIRTTQTGDNTWYNAPGITGIEQDGGGNDIFWGWLDARGRIAMQAGDGPAAKSVNPINNGQWHFVALTRDSVSGQVRVYVDGVLNATATSATGLKTTPFSSIGRIVNTAGWAQYFAGSLDDLRFYNRVLSASEVQTIMRAAGGVVINLATGGTATASSQPTTGKDASKAFDISVTTAWLGNMTATGSWLQYQFAGGIANAITAYAITSAADTPSRDPRSWQLLGSNDGTTWTTLDTQTNQSFSGRSVTKTYSLTNTTAYRYYRLAITANNGSTETQTGGLGIVQLAELQLLG